MASELQMIGGCGDGSCTALTCPSADYWYERVEKEFGRRREEKPPRARIFPQKNLLGGKF